MHFYFHSAKTGTSSFHFAAFVTEIDIEMSSLEISNRNLVVIISEAIVCLAVNIITITGNTLVCLAVYKNPKLRSTTNLYIFALAVSDLLCATVEMPLASAVLITGRWSFGEALCHIQGFVDVFATYVTPATLGLTALNRYMRIVKTKHYNHLFSPRRSKLWLICVWLSLSLYLFIGRLLNWHKFEFIPGYAVCSITITQKENRIVHYCIVFGLLYALPFCVGFFSYYKVLSKIREHKQNVAPSLVNVSNNNEARISVKEIKISRALFYVGAGFLFCWIPLWTFLLWKRFSPETAPRIIELLCTFMLFLSASINPIIYTVTNGDFRGEFYKLLCWWKVTGGVPSGVVLVAEAKEKLAKEGGTESQENMKEIVSTRMEF